MARQTDSSSSTRKPAKADASREMRLVARVEGVARYQAVILWLIVANFILLLFSGQYPTVTAILWIASGLATLICIILLATRLMGFMSALCALLYVVVQVAGLIGVVGTTEPTEGWGLSWLAGAVSLGLMAIVVVDATWFLRSHGIRVGLMGANYDDVDYFRRQIERKSQSADGKEGSPEQPTQGAAATDAMPASDNGSPEVSGVTIGLLFFCIAGAVGGLIFAALYLATRVLQ